MPTSWTDTYLHKTDFFGRTTPMGAGPYGATEWTTVLTVDGAFVSTGLEDPPGSTSWEVIL